MLERHRLSGAQLAVVDHGGGILAVTAGAGTGKTTAVTARIARLAALPHATPSRIVAVTFTRKAAREMATRLEGAAEGARIGTIHALAASIIRRNWAAAGLSSSDLAFTDQDEETDLMDAAVSASGVDGPDPAKGDADAASLRKAFRDQCLKRVHRWKENGLTSEAATLGAASRGRDDVATAAVYARYQEALSARGLMDFSDLALLAVRVLLSDPRVLEAESDEVEHLLVDEFQDTNWAQAALLRLLARRAIGVTVVGDPDQSLYSWRGAISGVTGRAREVFPEAAARGYTEVALVENRRCTDDTLGPANLLVDYNSRTEPKVLKSGRAGAAPTVASHPTDQVEARDTVRRVSDLMSAGAEPSSLCVLGRSGFVLESVSRELALAGVPHALQKGSRFSERQEVCDVFAYLKLAMRPSLDTAFARIASRPSRRVGPETVAAALRIAASRAVPVHEALAALAASGVLSKDVREGAETLSRDLDSLASAARSGESSEALVRYVLETVGYSGWANSQKKQPRTLRSSLEAILSMARDTPSFPDFMVAASVLEDPAAARGDGVHVGTLHGSKGLEFDHVFIVGLEDGVIPSPRSMEEASSVDNPDDPFETGSAGGLEEERRLLHVGMTRARIDVHLSYAAIRGGEGRRRESKPSRLLREAELSVPRQRQTPVPSARGKGPAKNQRSSWW